MLSNPKIRSPYIDEYFGQLDQNARPSEELLSSVAWPWKTREALDALGLQFGSRLPNGIKVRFDLKEYVHEKHGRGLFLLGVLYLENAEETAVATLARSFRRNTATGDIEVWGDGLRIDHRFTETKSAIFPILKSLDAIYAQIGVRRERLVADWRGRMYWTQADYQFDPDYRFNVVENGKLVQMDQITAIRRNFLNFLSHHGIALTELAIQDGPASVKPVASIEDFNAPQDFVRAKHPTRKVSVRALLDVDTFEDPSAPMDVGMAFTLSDYSPSELVDVPEAAKSGVHAPIFSCTQMLMYNATAMPPWRAIRVLPRK